MAALPELNLRRDGRSTVAQLKLQEQPVWLWPNLLSLDAPLIAVLWLHLFAAAEHIEFALPVSLVLALTVWMIYVADRLLDGLRAGPLSHPSARHQFHRAHPGLLFFLLIAALPLTAWISLKLDLRTLQCGILLMLCVCGYFFVVHWIDPNSRFPKEPVVAVVFGIGTFFPVWIHTRNPTSAMVVALVLCILICWLNLELIEYAEWAGNGGSYSEIPHGVTGVAGRNMFPLCAGLAIGVGLLSLTMPSHVEQPVMLAVALSAGGLGLLAHYRGRMSLNLLRVLADAALLSPAVILLFRH
jgi:hypothetical protein